MPRFLALALTLGTMPGAVTAAAAQTVHGYGFGGPAGIVEEDGAVLAHFGGGAEFLTPVGFGASVEVGRMGKDGTWINHVSVDGTHHFLRRDERVEPFVSAGYTRFFEGGEGINTFNFGGGVNVWAAPRVALRIDVRDHVYAGNAVHVPSVRFGVTVR
jgi:hypothetical protein